ncbi:hypothetical protein M9H77_30340 [Catharanthus roseus]|uniref:Uncharacterized protein n=1 Tax=Catharanthus roseus TaxID=4058 RepID=A0ACC0A182_CATRO|nr:hypothetical protein M9H77_30340 [Catharanthus roseus]
MVQYYLLLVVHHRMSWPNQETSLSRWNCWSSLGFPPWAVKNNGDAAHLLVKDLTHGSSARPSQMKYSGLLECCRTVAYRLLPLSAELIVCPRMKQRSWLFNKLMKDVHCVGVRLEISTKEASATVAPTIPSCSFVRCKSTALRLVPPPEELNFSVLRAIAVAAHLEFAEEELVHCCADGEEVDIQRPNPVLPRPRPLFSLPLPFLPLTPVSALRSVHRSVVGKPTKSTNHLVANYPKAIEKEKGTLEAKLEAIKKKKNGKWLIEAWDQDSSESEGEEKVNMFFMAIESEVQSSPSNFSSFIDDDDDPNSMLIEMYDELKKISKRSRS